MGKEKGITLIALVVTIIVLLILAGIALSMTLGENGIIKKSKEAANIYKEAETNENSDMTAISNEFDNLYLEHVMPNRVTMVTIDGKQIPKPKGFTISKADGENSIATGLVIYEGEEEVNNSNVENARITRNQFVWVPVDTNLTSYKNEEEGIREPDIVTGSNGVSLDNTATNLENAGLTEDLTGDGIIGGEDFKKLITEEFEAMAESVNKYKGFFIGRYELSLDASRNAQSIKGATSANQKDNILSWYGLYEKGKTYMSGKDSIVSSMIYGAQYDKLMIWIGGGNTVPSSVKRNSTKITGTSDTDFINNIYDLYGNRFELTQEAASVNGRVYRGGDIYSSDCNYPNYRGGIVPTNMATDSIGTRLAIYINTRIKN